MLYWAEFKEFRWSFPDQDVLLLFWKKCQDRYRDMVYHMKKDDYQVGKKPDFVRQEDWPAWIAYWQAEETQEKARLAKRNRNTEPDGPGSFSQTRHGGARSAVDHMRDLRTGHGRDFSPGGGPSSSLGSGSLYTQAKLDALLAEMHAQMDERLSAQQAYMEQVLEKQARMESLLERLLRQQLSGDASDGSGGSGSSSGWSDGEEGT
ncbi:hypothetical protein C2S51_029978 [Perilla frutescens var. frutescens]|nr:hypothetical protein C2S51_029978 [Perilla frutescens var. frutescens]